MTQENIAPLFTNDAIVFGILMLALAFVFHTSQSENKIWKSFYKVVPALLMCYLIPSLLNSANIISKDYSNLYSVAKNYLLPASLVLMTLSIDMKGIMRLGPKSLIMFFTATVGIVLGGPLAILIVSIFSPETVGGAGATEVWRGLATLAGSWIGGGANQTAMLEIYKYDQTLYSGMVAVDIIVANIWMAFILYGVGKSKKIDKWLKADASAIETLKNNVESYQNSITRVPTLKDLILIGGIAFGAVGFSHMASETFVKFFGGFTQFEGTVLTSAFFWIVVVSTTIGLALSFTKARQLEGAGASKMGSVFIYILVATIGMKMDITKTLENPGLLVVGLLWMGLHVALLVAVAKAIRAPFFFLAVGSKANVGGAASAPVVASAFHPSLAPVGVLLAVLGYALGTYGAIICAQLMQLVSP
ncbi:DUF819 family protein [Sediminitomix flava]|uniref:Putative membrane protein n=1 Tax=Sediminitomix flava TaxID=379075 RepID=A0A315ZF18_SEDFL|nr:DUF819 family protein [Sediminitomix flava]PWJ43922.1 putative membrane protein [Sediminitomix flava]